jgi:hypothetical protein
MEESTKGPAGLLDILRGLGVLGCERMTPDDLDWLFGDKDAAHFLQHVIRFVDVSAMALGADRVNSWNTLQKKRPEDILKGRALEEAVKVKLPVLILRTRQRLCVTLLDSSLLQVFEDEESKSAKELSDEELRVCVARLEEETDLQRAHLDQLDRLTATMSKTKAAKGKIKSKMPRLQSLLEQELRAKHEKVLVENQR